MISNYNNIFAIVTVSLEIALFDDIFDMFDFVIKSYLSYPKILYVIGENIYGVGVQGVFGTFFFFSGINCPGGGGGGGGGNCSGVYILYIPEP